MNSGRFSFRDPGGWVFRHNGRILRAVQEEAQQELLAFLGSLTARRHTAQGSLVDTRVLAEDERDSIAARRDGQGSAIPPGALIVEHAAVPFPSFPYEWCPEMLRDAGRLTLGLAEDLLEEGRGLKDASAYNILFCGSRPVFVDVLSVAHRAPADDIWLPYAQFQRNFVLPLVANRVAGLRLSQIFLSYRDGSEPEAVYALLGPLSRLHPRLIALVSLPTWLGRRRAGAGEDVGRGRANKDPDRARFVLRSLLRHLRRQIESVAPRRTTRSVWLGYMEAKSYSESSFAAKRDFVVQALDELRPEKVLDVGCNTGFFSNLAAAKGATVVAIDNDPEVVARAYADAVKSDLDILALVVDIGRPSPALGWRNAEQPSFLARARGEFDLVLALAVLHHLLVTDGVPLEEILSLLAELTRDAAIVEFVAPADPMFRRLARGRDPLHAKLTREAFEAACARYFRVSKAMGPLDGTRWLYLLHRNETPLR